MKYIKKVYQAIVNLLDNIYKILVFMLKAMVAFFRGNKSTKPRKLGNKIVILGNGPSNSVFWENYDKFKEYDILCVNFFPLESEDIFFSKKPKYLSLFDPAFWGECDGKLGERVEQMWEIIMRVDWELFIVTSDRYVRKANKNNIKMIHITSNTYGGDFIQLRHFLYRHNFAEPRNSNVVISSIFFALTFGFDKVALWGNEYNTFASLKVENDGDTFIVYQYYYGSPQKVPFSTHGRLWLEFQHTAQSFRAHSLLRQYADETNRKIVNFSKNTHIDTYPVMDISKLKNKEE